VRAYFFPKNPNPLSQSVLFSARRSWGIDQRFCQSIIGASGDRGALASGHP
jgi:hypothetical protein